MAQVARLPARPEIVSALAVDLEPYPPIAEQVIEGELNMRARTLWTSPDGTSATGVWQCDPVKLHLEHPYNETFVVLEGRLTVTPDGGVPREMGPGDAIVLAHRSRQTWEIHETVTKVFSVHLASRLPWSGGARGG